MAQFLFRAGNAQLKQPIMSEELNGGQQANQKAGESETLENEEVVFSDDEKALLDEETTKKVDSLFGQKKHWREKHSKVAQEFEVYKKKHPETPEPKKEPEEKKPLKKDDEIVSLRGELQEIRLGQANPTLKPDDIKKAIAYAKAEGVEPQELINSDFFQSYLSKKAEKEAAEKSAPNPSNRSGSAKMDYSKLVPEQIAELSDEEYPKYQKWLKETQGGNQSGLTIKHRIGI